MIEKFGRLLTRMPMWVETTAWTIRDPVRRLRFLQAVATKSPIRMNGRASPPNRRAAVLVLAFVLAFATAAFHRSRHPSPATIPPFPIPVIAPPPTDAPSVWLVETSSDSEIYSNGLRIGVASAVTNRPRSHDAVGIVFHSTESELAPFEAGHNDALIRIGESLLEYICRRRAYHYLIDRFGRVYRSVAESDAANHAGHSVWEDGGHRYVDLNDSFLGVAFESRGTSITPAQVRSGAMLIEMLRRRYDIPARNCVTHAQVSVNPANRLVGWHVDWASGFPFTELGLPDNYAIDLPAIWAFGYRADQAYLASAGKSLRRAVAAAERRRDATPPPLPEPPAGRRTRFPR